MSHPRVRLSFGYRSSCLRLPATVAFPVDARLLDRIEKSRSALPVNSIKPLWRNSAPAR